MRAFSLAELLVSIAILTIISAAVLMVMNFGDRAFHMDSGLLQLQQEARRATEAIARDLRSAHTKSIDASGAVITFSTPSSSGAKFYRDTVNNRLIREFPAGTTQVVGNHITALSFCCWHDDTSTCTTDCSGSNLVSLDLTSSNNIRGRDLSFSLRERVNTRNE